MAPSPLRAACDETVTELVAQGFGLLSVYLLIGGRLRCQSAHGYVKVLDGFPPGTGVIGRVVATGHAVVIPDVSEDPTFVAAVHGVRGEACAPVIADGQVVGAVNVETRGQLPAGAGAAVTAAATSLGARIEQLGGIPSASATQRLTRAVVTLTSLEDVSAIERSTIDSAIELTGMSSAFLARRDRQGQWSLRASTGPMAPTVRAWSTHELARIARWVESGTAAYLRGDADVEGEHGLVIEAGVRAAQIHPLTAGGHQLGILVVADPTDRPHDPAAVEAVEVLAAQAATSISTVGAITDLRRRANQDPLTGLHNAAAFSRDLARGTAAATHARPIACFLIDIDHFKRVNDTHGHLAGDRVLRELATALRGAVRDGDLVYRVGGDEFAAVATVADDDDARAIADRLLAGARQVETSVSIGVATATGGDPTDLRARADTALYAAKAAGRGVVRVAPPEAPSRDDRSPGAAPTPRAGTGAFEVLPEVLTPAGGDQASVDVLDSLNQVVFEIDPAGRWASLNRAWGSLTGLPVEWSIGRPILERVHPQDRARNLREHERLVSGRATTTRFETRVLAADGVYHRVAVWARTDERVPGSVIGTLTDVTEHQREVTELERQAVAMRVLTDILRSFADAARAEARPRVRRALETLGRYLGAARVTLAAPDGDRLHLVHGWADGSGDRDPAQGRRSLPRRVLADHERALRRGDVIELADADPGAPLLPRLIARAGIEGLVLAPVRRGDQLTGLLVVEHDGTRPLHTGSDAHLLRSVADAAAATVLIAPEELDLVDPVTGVASRALTLDRIDHALAHREDRHVGVLMLDVDGFRIANESLGRGSGDRILRTLAARWSDELRQGDTLGRFAGDQFVVVTERVDARDLLTIAERLRGAARRPMDVDGTQTELTVSVGVSVAGGRASSEQLVHDAETAMRRARAGGRDRVELFDPSLRVDVTQRWRLSNQLRAGIARDELRLHFQPIVESATHRTTGMEALVRWQHPDRGLLGPGAFLELAERTGSILPLGHWVLRAACRQFGAWLGADPGLDLRLAVNVSTSQLLDPSLPGVVLEALDDGGVAADRLVLEVTESTLMGDLEVGRAVLEQLRATGVRTAIDDFGTGFSSLSYLKRLPADIVKIDRAFIRNVATDPTDRSIVEAVVRIARSLGADVVAEGIEDAATAAACEELGVGYLQGYHFGRPAPASELGSGAPRVA